MAPAECWSTVKKPIILLVALMVLAVAAVLVGPGLVDWGRYKDQVTARIGTATGLRVAIDGEMDLALLPRPTFKASGVRIADLSGAVTPDLASVEALEVQVALMPLLGGEIEVQRVALLRPVLTVETRPDGGTNWSLAPGGAVPGSIRLERVNIQDGVLVWRDGRRGREERIEDIDISLSAASLSGPIQLVGSATVRGLPLTLDLSTSRLTGAGALPLGLTLGLPGGGATVRLAGIASLDNGFQGEISGDARSLRDALDRVWPGRRLSGAADPPFAFEATMRAVGDTVELTKLTASLGDTIATGSVRAELAATPHVDLSVALNRIDLDSWLSGAEDRGVLGAVAALGGGSLVLPTGLTARVDMAVDAITLRRGLVRQARLEGFLDDGLAAVSRLTAQLPGGSDLALAGTLSSEAGRPRFDLDVQAAANDLRGVLGWMGYPVGDVPSARLRRFSGSASISGRADSFQVSAFDLVVDGTRATGGLAYVDRGRPGIGLRLDVSRVNLDSYRAPGQPALIGAGTTDRLAALLAMADANLDLTMAGLTVDGISLRDIRLDATVTDGAITFREAAIGDAAGASLSLNGSIAAVAPLSGADVAFTFATPDPGRLARSVGLSGRAPLDRLGALTLSGRVGGGDDALAVELLADAAGGTLEFGGSIRQPWTAPGYDLALRLRHPDLDSLLATWAPDYRPLGPLGPLDLFGAVTGTPEALAVDSLQGTLGAITLAGHSRIERRGERRFVEAALRTSEIRIDPWVAQSSRPAGRSSRRWSTESFDLSALAGFDGSLVLTATALTAGSFHLVEPSLEARLSGGVLDLAGLSGRLFGGALGASGRLDVGGGRPAARLSLDLVGADMAEALAAAAGIGAFAGTMDIGFDIETGGGSPAELVANLTGSGLVAVRDGQVRGIDMAQAAAGLGGLTDPLQFLDLQRRTLAAGSTAFAALNATFDLADGIAETDDARLVGEHGTATGRGAFDLSRWQVDLTTRFDLAGMPDAPPFGVRLIGAPDDPERVLQTADLQAFIARRAADAVSRRFDDARRRPPDNGGLPPATN